MRPRFSLRWLFLATALVAVLCYWLVYPTVVANRFVRSVAAKDYALADTCFQNPNDRILFDLNENHWRFKAQAELEPQSFTQLLRGLRIIWPIAINLQHWPGQVHNIMGQGARHERRRLFDV
ncbi:MAG: hypothetical protein L0228_04205, partial [Planctomycetes bacterium]|nr:hypothetical protein [Planctomycetota bacterium]